MTAWLRRHGAAAADAAARLLGQPLGSLFSVLVLASAIALPVLAAIALRSAAAAAVGLDTEPHLNVFLTVEATDADARRVEAALRGHRDAAEVRFISRADALAELEASTHLAEALRALDGNPLPHAFTVRVRSTAAERVAAMREAWSRLPQVDQVVADFEWAQRLAAWVRFGDRLLFGAALLLAAAMVFIVGHLIRLQVVTRRPEIEVSQLVGATAADVRRPFLYHGAFQGALAGAAAVGIAWAASAWVAQELLALTPEYASGLRILFLQPQEALAVVAGAGLLGWAGAFVAARREIRRFAVG